MRATNCKTVCREIDESDIGQDLSSAAREHVQSCEHCRGFYDGRRELRLMLGSLETVAAPSDFEFRVRTRLANKEAGRSAGFFFGNRSFGVPAAAVATLVLLLGAAFAFRTLMKSDGGTTALQLGFPASDQASPDKGNQETIAVTKATSTHGDDVLKANKPTSDTVRQLRRPNTSFRGTVASQRTGSRLAIREFSSLGASVVKQDDAVASLETSPVFAIETSSEPLKVSLDYETGISRTISLPTLSFGSQRAMAGNNSAGKPSTKGVW